MRNGRRNLSLFLSFLLVFSVFLQFPLTPKAEAQTIAELRIGQTIDDWLHDETNGYIYAVSKSVNKLYFIRLSDFQIEKELLVGSGPSDVVLAGGKLYIPLSGSTTVAVVDPVQKVVEKTLVTSVQPFKIAVHGNKLLYMESDYAYLNELDMTTGVNRKLSTLGVHSTSRPDLVIDAATQMLYIGESGTSGGDAIKVRLSDYTEVGRSNFNDGYGFSYPSRKIVIDGQDVFYAGYQLDANDLKVIDGKYQSQYYEETVHLARGNVVVTDRAIYDRNNFAKMMSLPFTVSHAAMDAANHLYLFDDSAKSIKKTAPTLTVPPVSYQNVGNKLTLNYDLTDWVFDETAGKIYAISSDANRLLIIRSSDLVVEGEVFVGSKPSDIELFGGKLYVALFGSTKVAVVDPVTKTVVRTLSVPTNPYKIEVAQDKMFYVSEDQWQYLRVYTFATGQSQTLNSLGSFSEPDLALDLATNTIYVGESSTSGGDVMAVRTTDYSKLDLSTYDEGYGFSNPSRQLFKQGADVFYAGHRLDARKLPVIHGNYTAQITHVSGDRVFTEKAVYDRETFAKVRDLPIAGNLALLDSTNNMYLWNTSSKTLQKENLDLTLPPAKGNYQRSGNSLLLDKKISDWVYDEASGYIYAVSLDTNRLMVIRARDLVVEDEMYIGSQPSDVDLYNGQLYVALSGSTKIVVADPLQKQIVKTMNVDLNPYRIEADQDKLFFTGDDQHQYLRVLTYATGVIQKLTTLGSYYYPDLLLDRTAGKLYIGESGSSGSEAEVIRTSDLTRIDRTTTGYSYAKRLLVKDGTDLFFAGRKFDVGNLALMYGMYGTSEYSTSHVLAVKGNDVFTTDSIYDRNGFMKKAVLPYVADQVAPRTAGGFYVYSSAKNAIMEELPPVVLSTTPDDGANDFPSGKAIIIMFNENVTAGSAYDGIEVRDVDGNVVPMTKDLAGAKLVLTPDPALQNGGHYTVTVPAGAVQDAMGMVLEAAYAFSFDVPVASDVTAPTVSSTNPADLALDVPLGQQVTVTFNEAVQAGVAFDSIVVRDAATNQLVALSKSIVGDTLSLQPTPEALMAGNTTYTVMIPANAVQDIAGNAMEQSHIFTFTTVADPVQNEDQTGPVVGKTDPANGAVDVSVKKSVALLFNEAVKAGKAFESIEMHDATGAAVAVTKSATGQVLTLTPVAELALNTVYTVTVPAESVTDVVGNPLKESLALEFTTQATLPTEPTEPTGPTPAPELVGISAGQEVISVIVDNTKQLAVTASFKDGSAQDITGKATYSSSNPAVATVDATGVVKGIAAGEAMITVTFGGKQLSLLVKIVIDECFIATASYGSKFEPNVVMLREFRNEYLLTNAAGQAFVDFYYEYSPAVAEVIAGNEVLKLIVRALLTPFVVVVYLLFHPQLSYMLLALFMLMAWRRSEQKKLML